jgi:hypothetical protein
VSYSPPDGDAVILNFGTPAPYTPPDGDNVILDFAPAALTLPFLFFLALAGT